MSYVEGGSRARARHSPVRQPLASRVAQVMAITLSLPLAKQQGQPE